MSGEAREVVHHPGSLESAAHELAAAHAATSGSPRLVTPLAALAGVPAWLTRAEAALADPEEGRGKAAEWLLDNAFVVRRAIRQIYEDMPPDFYARLRPLATGDRAGPPRVYALARALMRSTDAQLVPDATTRFVNAYQEVTAFDIAELWAFPTMLRLACLELLVTGVAALVPKLPPPFMADPCTPPPAALDDTECVARAIRGLVSISAVSWKDFFRRTSVVERVLHEDPLHVYGHMDFATCDRYRKVVEALAHATGLSEVDVARRAITAARQAANRHNRRGHVGYWLIDQGRPQLEASLGYRPRLRERYRRRLRRHEGMLYVAALVAATSAAAAVPAAYLHAAGTRPVEWITGMLLFLLPASCLAITAVHALVTSLVRPRLLPKLAFDDGIPPAWKTVVAIPTLLASHADVAALLRRIERHFLANPDPTLQFVLLTDFTDAPASRMPGDDALLEEAVAGIRSLNVRHRSTMPGAFHLLHRERRYNPAEACWMGWERKRGKLEEFNRLLGGDRQTSYVVREGDVTRLHGVRFVITLDRDTLLPQGAAAQLVGILAHPLNRPEFDPRTGRVRAGYTIIQPRIMISPDSGNRSRFARLYAGDTSIDIYTCAVSDVYQDLFGTGIYVGKGIYDVAAFRRSVADRVPENALASHDLFEGIHGRTALATDVVLYEDYPPQYLAYTRRLHRWTRGDWQLVPWLRRRVPTAHGRAPNRLTGLDRWKILDNLRRTLVAPARLLFLVAGWIWFPGNEVGWTALGLLAPADSLVSDVATALFRGRRGRSVRVALAAAGFRAREHVGRWILTIAFLPHEAAVSLDATTRALVRLAITRRRLLQWTSAATTARTLARRGRALAWREMAAAPGIAVVIALVVATWHPTALVSAAPVLLVWMLSPEIALRLSRPIRARAEPLTAEQRTFVRALARRTWLFFETFVGPDDHWLPPDNYQEDPLGEVAHRTSPTNVGMMLLSTVAASDLGYLGVADLGFRVRSTLETLARLERHRGHLFNWYDTRTLEPLLPRYVSTVDSGNLAVSLIAVRQGCLERTTDGVLAPARWDGLVDTARLLAAAVERLAPHDGAPLRVRAHVIEGHAAHARNHPELWRRTIDDFCTRECADLDRLLLETVKALETHERSLDMAALRELRIWFGRTQHHLRSMHQDVEAFMPWLALLEAASAQTPGELESDVRELRALLPPTIPLGAISAACARAREVTANVRTRVARSPSREGQSLDAWLSALESALVAATQHVDAVHEELRGVAARAEALVDDMDFRFLYDRDDRLFHIGYNVDGERADPHHYDHLASEARLASFIAVAKRDVPVEHWFALARAVTRSEGSLVLLSWGGTMFEYLMPALLARSHHETLLAQSQRGAIAAQIAWSARRGVPWGVSESGYAVVNGDQHYQYQAFGVPALGLRRDTEDAVVVAPYATALALPLRPRAAVENLRRLRALGMVGTYGCYEALDLTPAHLPEKCDAAIVRSYMAHHQGMILTALDNHLHRNAFVRRFHADPRVQAAELLLHERVPPDLPAELPREPLARSARRRDTGPPPRPWAPTPRGAFPAAHVLGNGRLSCVITEAGAGALRWNRHALTRCRYDPTCDDAGLWIYVRDEESGALWSAGRQPTRVEPDEYATVFHAHMAELHRRDHGIALRTEIAVSPSDDVEIRYLALQNETAHRRRLTVTSYGEVVLAPAADDDRHPAFSKLFVVSEHLAHLDALLFTRRPRRPEEHPPVLMHRVLAGSTAVRTVSMETDRGRFLGRNGGIRAPGALAAPLSGTVGTTLDAIMSVQALVELEPYATEHLAFVTVVGGARESVLETAQQYATLTAVEWALADAERDAARELRRLRVDPARLPEIESLLSILLYAPPALRCGADTIRKNRLGQPRLWGMGISGDLPVLLLRVDDPNEATLLEDLVRAHRLWQRRGVAVDLALLWEGLSGYEDTISGRITGMLRELGAHDTLGVRGGIHLVRADQVTPDERHLLEITARAIVRADGRSLAQQLADRTAEPQYPPRFAPTLAPLDEPAPAPERSTDLLFDNGYGGFTADGREYVIQLEPGAHTPAPWSNVLANADFGTLVTEAGGGYTWSLNSAERRLTPWHNDPVCDTPAEALYLRDEETAQVWTATPTPAGADAWCEVRHGAGYTTWSRRSHALEQTLVVFVALDDPVKLIRLRLVNTSQRARRITATYYAEWVLGAMPSVTRPFVVSEYDAANEALLARSAWNPDFGERVAFLAADRRPHSFTTDRREFLGREGDASAPAALARWGLSGTTPPGADPCAALQVHLDVAPGGRAEVLFVLGDARDRAQAEELLRRWRDPRNADDAWNALRGRWDGLLGAVTVRTPEPALDVMLNRWLLYQAVTARLFGRTGFYQSAGAFGFRDQLQDVMALVHVEPGIVRSHIVACAAHQFEEGDVLHWWHPPIDRGVRTRCSDDLLWLPYVTAHYVDATGDAAILDAQIPFLSAPPLAPGEHDRYSRFDVTAESASLFEHCRRALARGITNGAHGLPLIGGGDWNDGLDRVGIAGRGESVWLAWFAIATMRAFAALCDRRDDRDEGDQWRRRAVALAAAVEQAGWDGGWYRRAYDDDGLAWGSAASGECRIDSVSQSWAVLSGAGAPDRARAALHAADTALVRADEKLVCLLWPPFDQTMRDPGYIKAYPPGIRENGGQYTHAAAWLGWAFALVGDGDGAARILRLLNPIMHAATRDDVLRYRVEPYVIAADIGGAPPHVGRGGWTWYTGAAAWTWRLGAEAILGLQRTAGQLRIDPCIPREWAGFSATVGTAGGTLEIDVENPERVGRGVVEITLDGTPIRGNTLALPSDGAVHHVHVRLGERPLTQVRLA